MAGFEKGKKYEVVDAQQENVLDAALTKMVAS